MCPSLSLYTRNRFIDKYETIADRSSASRSSMLNRSDRNCLGTDWGKLWGLSDEGHRVRDGGPSAATKYSERRLAEVASSLASTGTSESRHAYRPGAERPQDSLGTVGIRSTGPAGSMVRAHEGLRKMQL